MSKGKNQGAVNLLRTVRTVHRTMGATLFIIFLIVSVSGLMLGWKKNSQGLILPKSERGTSADLADWLPVDSLHANAIRILHDSIDARLDPDLQRIDMRPQKGMVKFVFNHHYWGIQLDGATGELLAITRRNSDIVENVHDGSILDFFFGTDGEILKLIYTTITGTALLLFTITGFWLWYGPKVLRRRRKQTPE